MSAKRIAGTPYIGVLPESETHLVSGWWTPNGKEKTLVATDRGSAAYFFAEDRTCDTCGQPTGNKHLCVCHDCRIDGIRAKMRDATIEYAPREGAMMYSHCLDEYYHDWDQVEDRIDDLAGNGESLTPHDLLLCWCESEPPPSYDAWDDPLYDDDDGDWWDDACEQALAALNAAMAKAAPTAWHPTFHPVLERRTT